MDEPLKIWEHHASYLPEVRSLPRQVYSEAGCDLEPLLPRPPCPNPCPTFSPTRAHSSPRRLSYYSRQPGQR